MLEKKWEKQAVCELLMNLKEAYESLRREVLYNILIEFDVPVRLLRLIEMCLNENYSRFRKSKHFLLRTV
jgi:hypothetical protein